MKHHLKTHPEPFADLAAGLKTFEFRVNDRGFAVGDVLVLEEYVPEQGEKPAPGKPGTGWASGRYTGARCVRGVTHILRGPEFGIPDGHVIMSLCGNGTDGWPAR
jgi:hypothetical protein